MGSVWKRFCSVAEAELYQRPTKDRFKCWTMNDAKQKLMNWEWKTENFNVS